MKLSLSRSLQQVAMVVGSLGMMSLPAFGQLSALPPLHCVSGCFVPLNGVAVPGLEIVPWNDPRALPFLNNFSATVPVESPLGQVIAELGTDAINQAIQAGVNDPALINSFGQILVILANETPNLAALQQPEIDFITWIRSNVHSGGNSSAILEALANTESVEFARAVAEVLATLSPQELANIDASRPELQAFLNSLPPQTPAAQISLSQRSQEIIYDYLLDRSQLRHHLRNSTGLVSPADTLDLSGLNLQGLPTTSLPIGLDQSAANSGVHQRLQSEVVAYQIAYGATEVWTDLLKAETSSSELDPTQLAQEEGMDIARVNRPWSVFITGDMAWGNTQSTTTFDVNQYVVMAGADYTFNPNVLVGGAVAYSTGSQRNDGATAEADSVTFNLYGTGRYGVGGYTTGFVGYGFDHFTSRRTVAIPGNPLEALGTSSGHQFNIGVETGWVFVEGGLFIQPSLGLRYASSRVNGYTETGAGVWSTAIDSYSTSSTLGSLSLDLAYPILAGERYIMPFVGVGLNHRLSYSAPVVTARFVGGGGRFVVPVADVDSTWVDLSLGVSADLSRHTVGQIIFRTDIGRSDANLYNLSVNLRHTF